MRESLSGKLAMVTGSASGIGKAIAMRLAEAGARLVLIDRDEAALREAQREIVGFGNHCDIHITDLADSEQIEGMFAAYGDQPIHILVNAAGITKREKVMDVSLELWTSIIDINLRACFLCIQHAVRRMPDDGGRIVNISSHSAVKGSAGRGAYAASKGGLDALTRVMAVEFASKKITVNCILPGPIESAMTLRHSPEERQRWLARLPMQRYGKAEEIAALTHFLCTEQAGYITGQSIGVDGGFSISGLTEC